jgi:hypothetical protein
MRYYVKMFFFLLMFFIISGCAYRYYLGFHGPSIKLHPDQHEGVRQDKKCLECHAPNNNAEAPPSSHPHFTGCIKCHNDNASKPLGYKPRRDLREGIVEISIFKASPC